MTRRRSCLLVMLVIFTVSFAAASAGAFSQYSENKDLTNCRECHGDFRASPYTSLTDGGSWTDGLHDVHRDIMLGDGTQNSGDCDTCHGNGPFFPVLLGTSVGGIGLDPISCSGCHGRAQDGTGVGSEGYGAGLRQHHWRAGVQDCVDCHDDADPAAYTPVEEDFLPPYYADNDPNHPLIPSDPCNPMADGYPEDYAASTLGLDNDGDDDYDEADLIACPEPGEFAMLASGGALLALLARRRRP